MISQTKAKEYIDNSYFSDISIYSLLSQQEEQELAYRVKSGCADARAQFIHSNLRLVIKIAKLFQGRGVEFLDLINEGNIGLMQAVDKFDPDLGYRFSTYAVWWIKQSIDRAIMNQGRTIRIPVHVIKKVRTCERATKSLREARGYEPHVKDIAEEIGTSIEEVSKLKKLTEHSYSLEHGWEDSSRTEQLTAIDDDVFEVPENLIVRDDLQQEIIRWHLDWKKQPLYLAQPKP
ncbi:RNA polymerase sigma factor RpoS [Vibrio mediterranei]|uniref:sigma-70 family RNA polymerase sigma factor n=1 Tax=Vibrio mediterranei TaxID=689 RepID=UPI0007846F77|nr:sigma-70 family RNA polymerase sigma factor [Vibrio mediterranei]SBO09136.1 RNA polymerase sigma factor RpoS [Vibrio mediterranei]